MPKRVAKSPVEIRLLETDYDERKIDKVEKRRVRLLVTRIPLDYRVLFSLHAMYLHIHQSDHSIEQAIN